MPRPGTYHEDLVTLSHFSLSAAALLCLLPRQLSCYYWSARRNAFGPAHVRLEVSKTMDHNFAQDTHL